MSETEVKEVALSCQQPFRLKSSCLGSSVSSEKPNLEEAKGVQARKISVPDRIGVSSKRNTHDEKDNVEEEFKNSMPRKRSIRIVTEYIPSLKHARSEPKITNKRHHEVWGYWSQPDISDTCIRSKTYLSTSLKVRNGTQPLLELTHVDLFQIRDRIDNVGCQKHSWLSRACPARFKDRKFLIINIQITSLSIILVQYFVFNNKGSTGCDRVDKI